MPYAHLDGIIAETMYVKRQPRDASHSTTPSKNTFVNPYVYGLGRLPDTEVVNYKECLEYDLAHLDPSLTAKHTPKGSFVKNRKVCDPECVEKRLILTVFFLFF